jgi:hypothetical protein
VQQCGACNTGITLDLKVPLPKLNSFALWLPKHAALVNSITAKMICEQGDAQPPDSHIDEAQRVLHQALQLAGTAAAAPPTAAMLSAAAVAASVNEYTPTQQQKQQGLRLASFSSDLPSAELLAALPAHSLTHLEVYHGCYRTRSDKDNSSIAAALARLSSLQHLELTTSENGIPVSALEGVAQLSRLTALELYCTVAGQALTALELYCCGPGITRTVLLRARHNCTVAGQA